MKITRLTYLLVFCCLACNKKAARNFLFDMEPPAAVTAEGFLKITPEMRYTPETGYGWTTAPSLSFDSVNLRYGNALLNDGVLAPDSLVFRADVPSGEYFITVTIGGNTHQSLKMGISLNGELLEDSIVTALYRITHKTVRRRIRVAGNSIQVSIASSSTPVGLHGIELRPVTTCKAIPFETNLKEDTTAIRNFAAQLLEAARSDSGNISINNQLNLIDKYLKACNYYNGGGWLWAVRSTGMSLLHRMHAAVDLLEQVCADPEDPLYYRAVYLLGKIHYWLNEEDGDAYQEQQAQKYFRILLAEFPDNEILKMYAGERIPHLPEQAPPASGVPLWAAYQKEAMRRMLELIHWWVTVRQAPNGEMGGKYGDDVELLRWWLPAILGADDSTARAGYKRLADGVWNSDLLERGFSKRVDDVEHSAELFRDTHPGMFLINYGDPEYVERCMVSMQNFRDVWTGITSHGHRHFKSYYLSATEVLEGPPYGVDIPLNARAALPGLWAAWYNRNPDIVRLFKEWSSSWVEDADRTDLGKPRGIIPAAVAFDKDHIGGYSSEWYDPHLSYSYYRWESLGHVGELYYQLTGMYGITGDPYFLKPVNAVARIMTEAVEEGPAPAAAQKGSSDWAKQILLKGGAGRRAGDNPMGKVFAMAKNLTGNATYDSLIYAFGHPYNRYLLTGDKQELVKALQQPLDALRYNYPLLTSEVKFTDRVYVPGSNVLMGMYTGHFGAGYEYPALKVSWKDTGEDIAVLVRKGDYKNLDVTLFNSGAEKKVTMNTWQLEPGRYRIRTGIDQNDDNEIDELLSDKEAALHNRVNPIEINVPAGKLLVVSVKQTVSFGRFSPDKPDLALTAADISFNAENTGFSDGMEITVTGTLHNIGNKTAKHITAELLVDGVVTATARLAALPPPVNLNPSRRLVNFKWRATAGNHRIAIRVNNALPELTDSNNLAELLLEISEPTGR